MQTITNTKGDHKLTMKREIYLLLKNDMYSFESDAMAMAEAGEDFTSSFEDYLFLEALETANLGSKFTVQEQIDRFKKHFLM